MRVALVYVVLMLLGCGSSTPGPSSANTPQEMFSYVIESPVPTTVTNLEGVGDTWQGYSLYLRFHAPDADINRIIASGYQPASWSDISYRFNLPPGYNLFSPSWSPASISNKECYEADVTNQWTRGGTHYLVVDRSTGTVYFYGIGA